MNLTNQCPSSKTKCEDCTDFLKHSFWRNEKVFLKSKTNLFCIRCIRGMVTDKQLDNFVKKQNNGIIPEIIFPEKYNPLIRKRKIQIYSDRPTRLTTRCRNGSHSACVSVKINCTCSCHRINHGEKK
mgnify:FL=1